jgi:hypothetical protein
MYPLREKKATPRISCDSPLKGIYEPLCNFHKGAYRKKRNPLQTSQIGAYRETQNPPPTLTHRCLQRETEPSLTLTNSCFQTDTEPSPNPHTQVLTETI